MAPILVRPRSPGALGSSDDRRTTALGLRRPRGVRRALPRRRRARRRAGPDLVADAARPGARLAGAVRRGPPRARPARLGRPAGGDVPRSRAWTGAELLRPPRGGATAVRVGGPDRRGGRAGRPARRRPAHGGDRGAARGPAR